MLIAPGRRSPSPKLRLQTGCPGLLRSDRIGLKVEVTESVVERLIKVYATCRGQKTLVGGGRVGTTGGEGLGIESDGGRNGSSVDRRRDRRRGRGSCHRTFSGESKYLSALVSSTIDRPRRTLYS
jgi:hypothetical protein